MEVEGRGYRSRSPMLDVPLEFVGQITGASAMTKASHVEGGAATPRHTVTASFMLGIGTGNSSGCPLPECMCDQGC